MKFRIFKFRILKFEILKFEIFMVPRIIIINHHHHHPTLSSNIIIIMHHHPSSSSSSSFIIVIIIFTIFVIFVNIIVIIAIIIWKMGQSIAFYMLWSCGQPPPGGHPQPKGKLHSLLVSLSYLLRITTWSWVFFISLHLISRDLVCQLVLMSCVIIFPVINIFKLLSTLLSTFQPENWHSLKHAEAEKKKGRAYKTKRVYALRMARHRVADRPAGGWPPARRIVMTP